MESERYFHNSPTIVIIGSCGGIGDAAAMQIAPLCVPPHAILSAKFDFIASAAASPGSCYSRRAIAPAGIGIGIGNGQPTVIQFEVHDADVEPPEPGQRDHDITCAERAAVASSTHPAPSPRGPEERINSRPVDGQVTGGTPIRIFHQRRVASHVDVDPPTFARALTNRRDQLCPCG
jgi:hypothetical protein